MVISRYPFRGRRARGAAISRVVLGVAGLVSGSPTWAHHAAQSVYFTDQIIEVKGEITSLLWRNPHVRFTLAVEQPGGGTEEWHVESIPVTRLTRVGVSADVIGVGQVVTVAGYPPRKPGNNVYAINLLLEDNREVLLDTPVPRWTDRTLGTGLDLSPGEPSADPSLGIFRVWSTDNIGFDDSPLPFTAEAEARRAAYDSTSADNPFRGCRPKGMPLIMQQPNPIEFIDEGDRVLLRIEEYDTQRVIWTNPAAAGELSPSILGRSVGRWEGSSLVVTTDRIDFPYFSQQGHRQSEAITLSERFAPSADGARLDYELTITEPALFAAPLTRTRTWLWVPGAQVLPFECTEG